MPPPCHPPRRMWGLGITVRKRWLLFFSSLPSQPSGSRVKTWRKLTKSGAVQLKGAVYVLPANDLHVEFFQRLVDEIVGMGGAAAFAEVDRIETVPDAEIVALFAGRTSERYRQLDVRLEKLEHALDAASRVRRTAAARGFASRLERVARDLEGARRTDFFPGSSGPALAARIAAARTSLAALSGIADRAAPAVEIPVRSPDAYRGRRWLTRGNPFVDRMASAWLIRRFVDPGAVFGFVGEEESGETGPGTVVFDAAGGEFTRVGGLCTFEVLVRSFALEGPAVTWIAGLVHDLDAEDDRHREPETAGVGAVLAGVRSAARDDAEALERGLAVFELLYAAKICSNDKGGNQA